MRKFFTIFEGGDDGPTVLDLESVEGYSDRRLVDFCRAAQVGQARWVGPLLVTRVCPWSVIKRRGSYEIRGSE